jgi:hypothetical protein
MKLGEYKMVLVAVGLIGVLLIASPSIAAVLPLPAGEQFSELYLLGPGKMAENYPYNIAEGQTYSVYVGVGNHLGSSAYYMVYVKLRNQTDLLPNSTTAAPSPLQPLYEYRFCLQDSNNWETPLTFSVTNASISGNQSLIRQLTINGVKFDVNKPSVWDSNSTIFSYQLVFELWLYNVPSNSVQYNNRFVSLRLNFTETT